MKPFFRSKNDDFGATRLWGAVKAEAKQVNSCTNEAFLTDFLEIMSRKDAQTRLFH